jgi:hypothetical protein
MTGVILHLARWLKWQLGSTERPAERPARITFFSASSPR